MIARPVRRAAITVCAAALAAACGGHAARSSAGGATQAASRAADTTPVQQASCPAAGSQDVEGGRLRMPQGATPGRTPLLLVVVPGGDGDADDHLGLGAAGNEQGFAILYPTTPGDGFWQLNDEFGSSDVEDVAELLRRQLDTGCFDQDRVSITGVSNGAGFSARMACKLPTTFAAVVPVAAGYKALDPCAANARASFEAIHGTADTIVPFNGKKPDRKGSVPRYTARWARLDGCSTPPKTSTPRALVTRFTYAGCDGGTRVSLVRLRGTDHGWPGSVSHPQRRPRFNPSGFSATAEVLRFVRDARRPGA